MEIQLEITSLEAVDNRRMPPNVPKLSHAASLMSTAILQQVFVKCIIPKKFKMSHYGTLRKGLSVYFETERIVTLPRIDAVVV
jgi:hypothetical protein